MKPETKFQFPSNPCTNAEPHQYAPYYDLNTLRTSVLLWFWRNVPPLVTLPEPVALQFLGAVEDLVVHLQKQVARGERAKAELAKAAQAPPEDFSPN